MGVFNQKFGLGYGIEWGQTELAGRAQAGQEAVSFGVQDADLTLVEEEASPQMYGKRKLGVMLGGHRQAEAGLPGFQEASMALMGWGENLPADVWDRTCCDR